MADTNGPLSRQRLLLEAARRDKLTLWELCLLNAGPRGHALVIGTPEHVADVMEHWFLNGAADGFNVMPAWLPGLARRFRRPGDPRAAATRPFQNGVRSHDLARESRPASADQPFSRRALDRGRAMSRRGPLLGRRQIGGLAAGAVAAGALPALHASSAHAADASTFVSGFGLPMQSRPAPDLRRADAARTASTPTTISTATRAIRRSCSRGWPNRTPYRPTASPGSSSCAPAPSSTTAARSPPTTSSTASSACWRSARRRRAPSSRCSSRTTSRRPTRARCASCSTSPTRRSWRRSPSSWSSIRAW